MTVEELITEVMAVLQREGRISYRILKRRFNLDDEYLEDLKAELIDAKRVAVDEDGKVLVWAGEGSKDERAKRGRGEDSPGSRVQSLESKTANLPDARHQTLDPSPVSYTPPHLAERIRAVSVAEGERKTITALFADLKGSTALIEGLDPEEARAIIDPALQLMMDAVHQYEGYVAQALGDGIFALFGAPIAHEDHSQRALYAALRMQEEMRRYSDQVRLKHGVPLLMRIGVNTGEVVVRSIRKDDLHTDYVPVGHSTNLAARMEQMATPGSILVTAYTQKLTEGFFAFKALGQMQIKGVEERLNVYEVLGTGPLRTRLQVTATRRGLTRFVGRQTELEQLRNAWAQAKAGHGQVVGVMGEPGLGKSRLVYEFKGLAQAGCLLLEAYSVSHGKASAYLPVIELLKSYFRIELQDDERTRREKVGGKVLMLDRSLEDTLPYLFALLGIEEQPSPLQQMDPQIRRRRTFDALKKLFLRESLNQPLVLIFEDLHWIDSETQGFLDTLSEGMASAKILLLANYRPEYRHEWGQKTYYTQLRLAPFGKEEAEEFLDALLGPAVGAAQRAAPLHTLKHLILDKTEGTPFFMEEVVQTLVEDGTLTGDRGRYALMQPVTTLQLPTTVQGVLAARIDRLAPDEKALLQQLAVIGREFPLGLVREVIALPEEELYRLLSSLQYKEFLYEQPAFPEVEYLFKHALTQEVAYQSVLHERRKALHERTAQAIELLYSTGLADHYSDLAHHYRRSGNTQKAVAYLHLAGQQVGQRSAYAEAIGHLSTALELLKAMPKSPERLQQELALQTLLGQMLMVTKGYAAPEVEQAYTRARELCQQVGETSQLSPALWGLWIFFLIRGELRTAYELAEQLFTVAQSVQDPELLLEAHRGLGVTSCWLGELAAARAHLEQGMTLYDFHRHHSHAFLYAQDPGMVCLSYLARALWYLGYPDQARQRGGEALSLAHQLSHPHSLAFALYFGAELHQYLREERRAQGQAEAVISLSTEQEFPIWLALGTGLRGWAVAAQGQREEGIQQIQQSLTASQATGMGLGRPYSLALLAEVDGKTGQVEEGLTALVEALEVVDRTGDRVYEAELYRLKGELLLTWEGLRPQAEGLRGKTEEAEGCFLRAIEVAQKQQAKSLELRAVMSLVRLRQQQTMQPVSRNTQHAARTRFAEARNTPSTIYNWFTEGFDTKDLQEAKALLEALA